MTTSRASRGPDRPFAGQRARAVVLLAAAATLAWSSAHWLTLRLADTHEHLHAHGIDHTRPAAAQQQLHALHAYLGPTALLSLLALTAALVGVRTSPGGAGTAWTGRAVVLAAGVSASAFVLIETAEHAATSGNAPPIALLAGGSAIHALAGAAAGLLSLAALHPSGLCLRTTVVPPSSGPAPPWEGASRRLPRALLAVLAGRAPPVCAAMPQPSL